MKSRENQKGSMLIALMIAICILAVLYIHGYIEETQKVTEQKQQIEESVNRAQESINQNMSNLEKTINDSQNELEEAIGD